MRLLPWKRSEEQRDWPTLSVDGWFSQYMSYLGNGYQLGQFPPMLYGQKKQETPDPFSGTLQQYFRGNAVVHACSMVRMLLFAEARFQFRQIRDGRPGNLFGNQDLEILEVPWPNGTTGDLLAKAIQQVDVTGNFYAIRDGDQLRVPRSEWMVIVLGSNMDVDQPSDAYDAEVVGYLYLPGGPASGKKPVALPVGMVAHWAPTPDPAARYRGMSWITPVVREVMADNAASQHKLQFFENGATPNMAVKMDPSVQQDAFQRYVDIFREQHEGVANAYKTLFLGGGADVTVVGANMRQIDFKTTQGAGETRIAAAAGVPPIIVGLSEGLQSATYSNYALAMRRFTDLTMRPLWRNLAGSLETIVQTPENASLWYDDRDIPALAEDANQVAQNQAQQATTMHTLISAGFEPDTVTQAVLANDFTKLSHSGLYSVQLQPAGAVTEGKGAVVTGTVAPTKAKANGNADDAQLVPAGT